MAKKILVVDDEPALVTLVKSRLESQGYAVTTAYNGLQALDLIQNMELPDLILLDIVMPGIKGDDVCRRLRMNDQTKHIPVLVITGSQHRELADVCLDCGADDVLIKPFDSQKLLQLIRQHITP